MPQNKVTVILKVTTIIQYFPLSLRSPVNKIMTVLLPHRLMKWYKQCLRQSILLPTDKSDGIQMIHY